eukprot:scaffold109_cov90-Skeletonema_marinoi.AAC.1
MAKRFVKFGVLCIPREVSYLLSGPILFYTCMRNANDSWLWNWDDNGITGHDTITCIDPGCWQESDG